MGAVGNEKIFGDGLLYEGVNDEKIKYRGETGAQDNIIPTLDIFTGFSTYFPNIILTQYLQDLRDYRPKVIIDFFNDLEKESVNIKLDIHNICGKKGLIYLLAIVNEIYLFRNGHWQFVQKYIMSNTKYNVATGGTPLNMWLPNQIEACLNCMNDIISLLEHQTDIDDVQELEEEDKILLQQLQSVQTKKIKLLSSQLEELKKSMYNLQKIIDLNKDLKDD